MRKKKPMPYPSITVRKLLMEDPEFVELLHGGTVSTRDVPDPLTKPHLTIAVVGMSGDDPMLRKPMVQVTPWVPDTDVSGLDEDPDVTAWNIAATAGHVLGRKRNVVIDDDTAMSIEWVDGPISLYDTKRGKDRVLYYAPARFVCALRHRY